MFQQVFVLWNLFCLTGTIANVIEYRPSSFATGLKEASAELGHPTSRTAALSCECFCGVGWDGWTFVDETRRGPSKDLSDLLVDLSLVRIVIFLKNKLGCCVSPKTFLRHFVDLTHDDATARWLILEERACSCILSSCVVSCPSFVLDLHQPLSQGTPWCNASLLLTRLPQTTRLLGATN